MIKVNYDPQTTLVKGYYPDFINYTSIPEPFIEITEEQHQLALGKEMCIINGVLQEYIKSLDGQISELKSFKISRCKYYLSKTDWYISRSIDGGNYPEEIKQNRMLARNSINEIQDLVTLEEVNNFIIDRIL